VGLPGTLGKRKKRVNQKGEKPDSTPGSPPKKKPLGKEPPRLFLSLLYKRGEGCRKNTGKKRRGKEGPANNPSSLGKKRKKEGNRVSDPNEKKWRRPSVGRAKKEKQEEGLISSASQKGKKKKKTPIKCGKRQERLPSIWKGDGRYLKKTQDNVLWLKKKKNVSAESTPNPFLGGKKKKGKKEKKSWKGGGGRRFVMQPANQGSSPGKKKKKGGARRKRWGH